MKRYYIDNIGKVHNYIYEKDNMISKAKCNICHSKMNYIFANRLGKHIKIGFICFTCNTVYASNSYNLFSCSIILMPINRMK